MYFHLAFAARPASRANWFAPGLSGLRDRAAAVAAHLARWEGRQQRMVVFFAGAGAVPSGILLFALLIVQANTGRACVGLSPRRYRAQRRRGLARNSPAKSKRCANASVRLAYWRRITAPPAGSLFYLPKGTCVVQPTQRIRWVNMPEPDSGAARRQAVVCR